jgi:hypothetical protein
MSIYQFLESEIPTIAYCVLHQARGDVPREEYVATMKELHERIRLESNEMVNGYQRHVSDALAREVLGLQHLLSHFLQMPIQSDAGEVQQLLTEAFERHQKHLLGPVYTGIQGSSEGRFFFVPSKMAIEKKVLKNGRTSLEEMGFAMVKGSPEIFESVFTLRGGANLDVIEHIVRDKLGIYSTTHGKHLKESGGFTYAAYNLVYAAGDPPTIDQAAQVTELRIAFTKPDVKYAPFRKGLSDTLEAMRESVPVQHVTLWQRKLGLGSGREFLLRILTDRSEVGGEILNWLNSNDQVPFVREAIIAHGQLTVKEMLML